MFITVWLFIFPFIFKFFFLVYTNGIHCLWALHLLGISLEYYILSYVARIFDSSPSIHQVYTAYYGNSNCWNFHNMQYIPGLISCRWYWEVYSSHCISLLYDCTLMSTHFYCIYSLYTVYTLCRHSHMGFTYTKRIHLVYLLYTSLHKKVYSVYNMYTSGFIFLGCLYDHRTFMLFQT